MAAASPTDAARTMLVRTGVGGGQAWTAVERLAPIGNGADWTHELDSEIMGNRVVGVLAASSSRDTGVALRI
jgi:hypothetical protein